MENRVLLTIVIVVFAGLVAGSWYYTQQHEEQALPPAPPSVEAPPTPKREPEIRYPVQPAQPEGAKSLPPLEDSDASLQQALTGLVDGKALARWLNLDSIVRRIVVTVDNLPRRKLPQQYSLTKPVAGKFLAAGKDDNLSMRPENARRYTPYVDMVETLDTAKLVGLYARFYPLLQQEYKNLGSPSKYFNDRLVEVIDDLLAAPDATQPIKLVQPKVFYQFADPALEELSAGGKIMVRIGPDNARRVKAKLREIRQQIISIK